jgi:diaminohydroxyphosphoribosylaminopyrimidine deaminase/5-amino-6-(5-phosphoribosylamino)uracil reductase
MSTRGEDKVYLDMAARAALRAAGDVEPNPLVGAVVVRGGEVLGIGHHRRFGGTHAEPDAIESARRQRHDVRGATMYVTLEPCNAAGRQPACVGAVIAAGISRVVYAQTDPNGPKAGGAASLRAAGIEAVRSTASMLATGISAPFIHRMMTPLPWVIAKWAQTIDGRVATRGGESKWISNDRSRARVHKVRARVDAMLTGIGTVATDDPLLTARGVRRVRRVAARVVADTDLNISPECALVRTAGEAPTIVACDETLLTAEITRGKREALEAAGVRLLGVPAATSGRGLDVRTLLVRLREGHGVSSVLLEAGPGMLGACFDADVVDEAIVYVAPMLLGDELARAVAVGRVAQSLTAARRLELWRVRTIESDIELTYRRATA